MKRKNLTLSALFCVLMSAEGWTGFHVCQADGTCVLRAYESCGSTCCGHLCISEAALYGGAAITLRVCRAILQYSNHAQTPFIQAPFIAVHALAPFRGGCLRRPILRRRADPSAF